MKKSEKPHDHAQVQPAAHKGGGAALASPQGERAAQLDAMVNASPAMVAQRKLFESIHSSPHQTAQRKQFDRLFGAAQRAADDKPLQSKPASAMQMKDGIPVNGDKGLVQRKLIKTNAIFNKIPGLFWLQDDEVNNKIIDPLELYYYSRGENGPVKEDQYIATEEDQKLLNEMHLGFQRGYSDLLPRSKDMKQENEKLMYLGDDDDFIESTQGEAPVSALAEDGKYAGSLGAGPCVLVLMRAQSNQNRWCVGSIHLEATDLETIATAAGKIRLLYADVAGKFKQDEEKMVSYEAYAIGGQVDEDSQLEEYSRLIFACIQTKFNLVGAKLPINGEEQSIDAYINKEGFVGYSVNEEQ